MKPSRALLAALAVSLAAACGHKDEPPPPQKPQPPEGRAETQSIRNTEAVGYGGKAIANKVDEALNKNDQQRRQVEQQSAEPPPE